jgi:hypothetical protein
LPIQRPLATTRVAEVAQTCLDIPQSQPLEGKVGVAYSGGRHIAVGLDGRFEWLPLFSLVGV